MKNFSPLRSFEVISLVGVPRVPGIYLICDKNGPVYGGRSKELARRLREHLFQFGSVRVAELIRAGIPLRFSFLPLDITQIHEAEAILIAQIGLTDYANIVHAGLYEDEVGLDASFDRRGRR